MSNQLRKVDGEKFPYFREVDGIRHYYLRKRTGTEDTEVALGTIKITMAGKLRDSWGPVPMQTGLLRGLDSSLGYIHARVFTLSLVRGRSRTLE